MTQTKRRILLVIGATLLVGGWAITRYVDVRQQSLTLSEGIRLKYWQWGSPPDFTAGRTIYIRGAALMVIGAGVLAFVVVKPESRA